MANFDMVYNPRSRPQMGHGVKIVAGMKPKDLPSWFSPIFEQSSASSLAGAGMAPLRYRGGKFYRLDWGRTHPLDSYTATETELFEGDWIIAELGGGIVTSLRQSELA